MAERFILKFNAYERVRVSPTYENDQRLREMGYHQNLISGRRFIGDYGVTQYLLIGQNTEVWYVSHDYGLCRILAIYFSGELEGKEIT